MSNCKHFPKSDEHCLVCERDDWADNLIELLRRERVHAHNWVPDETGLVDTCVCGEMRS